MKTCVLVADDEENLRRTIVERLARHGYETVSAPDGAAAFEIVRARRVDVAVIDVMMPALGGMELLEKIRGESPETQVVVMTGHATIEMAVEAMKKGALDYLAKPLQLAELDVVVEKAARLAQQGRAAVRLEGAVARSAGSAPLVGNSASMGEIRSWIVRAAASPRPVLIEGETGTGKELVARAIHLASPRAGMAFVAVNCGSLRGELLENELLGHERGAFTGATSAKQGLLEIASGGTLFLDEIGEMRPEAQVMLLRAIETGRFRRLGGTREIETDLRLVAATNRDIAREIAEGRFREDLYYRLAVVAFRVPPLRNRRGDIPLLVRHFRDAQADPVARSCEFTDGAVEALEAHAWPGNVRELRNIVERLLLLAEGGRIDADLVDEILGAGIRYGGSALPDPEACRAAVESSSGNKSAAARRLGISRPTLYKILRRMTD